MVIRHSLKILEQLSEIEEIIQRVETLADESGVAIDREILLRRLLLKQQSDSADS